MSPESRDKTEVTIDSLLSVDQDADPGAPESHEGGLPKVDFLDSVATFIGSIPGIVTLAGIEAVYIIAASIVGFDKYPFNFLTLVLSLIALQFSQVIILVQNRQGEILERKANKERKQVEEDLIVDAKAYDLLQAVHDHLIKETDMATKPVKKAAPVKAAPVKKTAPKKAGKK